MRALVLFTIGFSIACGIGAAGVSWGWLIGLSVAGMIGVFAAFCLRKRYAVMAVVSVICAGLTFGGGWNLVYRAWHLNNAIALDGVRGEYTVQLSDYTAPGNYGCSGDGVVFLKGKPYQIRIYFDEDMCLKPGDRVTGEFRFRVTTFGGAEEATYHAGKGFFLIAYQEDDVAVEPCEKTPWWCFPAVLRKGIRERLDAFFSGDAAGFARALLLGDSSKLSYSVDTAFKVSGIRHIIAVSGLHVSIFYGFLSVLTLRRRYLTLMLGFPVLAVFAAVAGFTPSVVRACIMVGLMMTAMAFGKEYDPPAALAFAVTVMLAVNPLTITNVGFQLSVASVAGILIFSDPVTAWIRKRFKSGKRWLDRCISGIGSSVGVTLGATLLTAPLCAWYFGSVSLVAVFTNLLTLWMVSLIFYGLIILSVLSLFWTGGTTVLSKILVLPIGAVLAIAGLLARLPMAAVYTRSVYIVAWLVFVYILLAVYLLSRKKKPAILCSCAILGLFVAQICSFAEPLTDECRVTVLDVGQGQCILLQGSGRNYLVDCGGDSDAYSADAAAETLLSQGITRLDGVIITHGDRDHAGGIANLLTRIDADLLLIPAADGTGLGETLEVGTGTQVLTVDRDMEICFPDVKISVFGPIFPEDNNENSLCILFSTENCDILITGDRSALGERSLLRRVELPEVDVLIAGHHGSRHSTCQELLEAVQPEIVIISVGENHYGHPSPETLARIREYTDEIYRTDLNGTVVFRR